MPKIVINGINYNGTLEESVLDVAKNNDCNIGYACGGNGGCQTCEIAVLGGMEALSEVNDNERAWLTKEKIRNGHRLACQAKIIREDTPIVVTTRLQSLIDLFDKAFGDKKDSGLGEEAIAIKDLVNLIGKEAFSHFAVLPSATVNSVVRFVDGDYSPEMVATALLAWRDQAQKIDPNFEKIRQAAQRLKEKTPDRIVEKADPIVNSMKDMFSTVMRMAERMTGDGSSAPEVRHIPIDVRRTKSKEQSEG
ncbi:MAG: (2Fe-2S)-binding protein [Chlorobiales bacterium]|nr:(2Fe-2S)-binding protein [Chlorobiales bacterium]